MMAGYTIYHEHIPWTRASGGERGLPLGRNIRRDSRDAAYPHQRSGVTLQDKTWTRNIPILDQGDAGSCTGNAETGALATGPLWDSLKAAVRAKLTEKGMALPLYSAAETIDGDGPYPPNDNGSTGQSVCQAAKNMGLISGYTHCTVLADILDALQSGPVITGVSWYDSFDTPSAAGLVTIAPGAQVRGGHEFLLRGISVADKLVYADNSWGTSWGVAGSFLIGWDTLTRLLAEQGDGTVSVPVTAPAPVPVPPSPVPVPQPLPADQADVKLWAATGNWAAGHHVGANEKAAKAVQAWGTAKGML
jgi:hypothetical protein